MTLLLPRSTAQPISIGQPQLKKGRKVAVHKLKKIAIKKPHIAAIKRAKVAHGSKLASAILKTRS
jgi:hypothetical protein